MHRLYIKNKEDVFVFHGEGLAPPLRGCTRQPSQRLSSGHCLERLILVVQGTPAQGRQFLARLQSFLERIRLGSPVSIHLQVEARADVYQSRVYAGDFNWVISSVQTKGFGLQLDLERDDFWEGTVLSLPLTNRYGTQVSGGLRVDNRFDGNGENQVTWEATDVEGELPSPAGLRLIHDLDPVHHFEQLYCGMLRGINNSLPVVEGEAASSAGTLTVVPDAGCNGGSYGQVLWSGEAEARLFSWQFSQVFRGSLTGLPLRPYLRFPAAFVCATDLWVYWKLEQQGLIFQSEAIRLDPARQVQELPILRFPASDLTYENLATVQVSLWGKIASAGTHELQVDAIFLLGLDGVRHFQAASGGWLAYGQTLIDQAEAAQPILLNQQSQQVSRSFSGLGGGLQVTASEHQSLQILMVSADTLPADANLRLEIRYRPRVRVLP